MFTAFLNDGRIFELTNNEVAAYATLIDFYPDFYILDKSGDEINYKEWSLPKGATFIAHKPAEVYKKIKDEVTVLYKQDFEFTPIYAQSQNIIKALRRVGETLDLDLIFPHKYRLS